MLSTPTGKSFALGVVVCLAVASSASVSAAAGPGTDVVRKANRTISKLLNKRAEAGSDAEKQLAAQVTTSVRGFLDIDELARRSLRDHWDSVDAAARDEFLALLRELIEKNYVKGLRANIEYEVVYTGEEPRGDQLLVTTEIKAERNGRPVVIAVDYVLRKDGNSWRTFDIITDGVGLVDNYRAQFNKIIAKDGFDGLLSRMRKKRDRM